VGVAALTNKGSDSRIGFEQQTSAQLALGASARWNFSKDWFASIDVDSYDVDAFYAGLSVGARFGGVEDAVKAAPLLLASTEPEAKVVKVKSSVCNPPLPNLLTLNFGPNSAVLSEAHKQRLASLQLALNLHPDAKIEAQGHTDGIGEALFNVGLSKRRAQAVAAFFEEQGVQGSQISAFGFGHHHPADTNKTAAGRANNRRVEIVGLKNLCE